MSIANTLLAEFEQQAIPTRKFLERLPEDKLSWKPHEKSLTAGQLALHIAQVPGGVVRAAQQDSIPIPDFGRLKTLAPARIPEILQAHDDSFHAVREILPQFTDARLPICEHLVALAGVGAEADRSADMIENDARTGKRPRQIEHLIKLRVVRPDIERKIGGFETSKPAAKFRLQKEVRRRRPQG